MSDPLAAWPRSVFTHAGEARPMYRRGAGPGVVVIHEIPGITPKVAAFGDDVVRAGFTVVMPSLLGTPGRPMSGPATALSVAELCVARAFEWWAPGAPRRSWPGCARSRPSCTPNVAGRGWARWVGPRLP